MMARQLLLFVFIIYYCANVISSDELDFNRKTLHVYEESAANVRNKRSFVFDADDDDENLSHHDRKKRDVSTEKQSISGNITVKVSTLKDSHKQLMVHWVGEQTDIIICLARDPKPRIPGVKTDPSAVYISYDYGDNYENKTDLFQIDNKTYASVDKFYNHQKYNTHFVFTDTKNKLLFTTSNHGRTIKMIKLDFEPSEVSFHEFRPNTFIVLDKSDPQKRLWLTEDFGVNWKVTQQFVTQFFWYPQNPVNDQIDLYIQRAEPSGLSSILASDNLFKGQIQKVFAEEVKDFTIKEDFMFITKKSNTKNNLNLYLSYKGGPLVRCIFDSELVRQEYHIADVTGTRVMVAVSHTDKLSNLYVSEGLGNGETVRFILSLEGVFCYFPNSTWRDSWLHHISEEAFADVYKVEGLTGIYIASQVIQKPHASNIGPQHLISLITYDHGGIWQPINAPKFDNDGQPLSCTAEQNCSLHLSQKFSQLYPDTRTPSIMSSRSAPGIIMATGVIGKSLKGHYGVYVSTDAGITWKEAIKDFCFFNLGDHGGILVAVKYYKDKGETRHVMYSTDEGEKWIEHEFVKEDLKLYGLMTEPGENTTVFTMFGSAPGEHQWVIVKLDLKTVFSYSCKPEDYKLWSPSQSDGHRLVPCVLGKQETYQRRIPHTNCFNGLNYDAPVKLQPCVCDTEDFECDFGFVRSSDRPSHCIKNKSISYDPYAIPKSCEPGQFYNRTKGYRKIDDDVCVNGFSYLYLPDSLPCPMKETEEFLIVAQRERINRVNLQNKELVEIPVQGLRNVIAIDFDMKNNCLYWADIVADTIGRQCLNNGTNYPEILVESNLASIEGMAFDWVSNILYFVDGMRAKIEMIRTDIRHIGRMRRTIIGAAQLKKPRGIAVHPKSGYIFWTDWAPGEPSVSRANMDGTNIKRLFTKPVVEWPNGVSIDHIAERIYWVDAREDYIASSDLDGNRFKKILSNDDRVSHPFAVAVFKDSMYWDDWKRNGIFTADKDHGVGIQSIQENLPGLMDLKVFAHSFQEGTNACSNKSLCEYICVGAPGGKHVCLCPDGMNMVSGKCLCPGNVTPFANHTCQQIMSTCSEEHFTCKNSLCVPKLWHCDDEDDCGDNSDEENCKPTTCAANMFTCGDGKCIPQYWKCDFENDCTDQSDEKNCENKNCTKGQFTCKNKRCIPNRWQCDGENDCGDGSDEECATDIPTTCKPSEFKCANSSPAQCFPSHWRCDGEKDCIDGSDESDCSKNTCADWQFMCKDKRCIYKNWVCDGEYDCQDNSDEANCTNAITTPIPNAPIIPTNSCHDWMFKCGNNKCIPYWWKCDNVNDCGDGTDEIGCGPGTTTTEAPAKPTLPTVCSNNQFQCYAGTCIPSSWVCDGGKDCYSGEDEEHCEGHKNCTEDQFKCKQDGSCIPLTAVCNKKYDCPDGSDEFCNDNHPHTPGTVSCSTGYFPCDFTRCIPLAGICDGKQDCYDGFDENDCNKTERVYQVLQMGVDERGVNSSSLLLYWWIPIPQNIKFEFMPSISKRVPGNSWRNHSVWIDTSEFRFTNLEPHIEYNMTVYVRVKGQPKGSIPAKYFTATTGEGVPSKPLKLSAEQRNGSHIYLKWEPPADPNGEIVDYEIFWVPPIPPIKQKLRSNKTTHLVTADFQPGVEYKFWIIAHNHNFESESSDAAKLKFDGDSDIDIIRGLYITAHTNSSISLMWHAVKGADGYNVTPEVRTPYPQMETITTNTNSLTAKNLSPGTYFSFRVRAFKKTYIGQESFIGATTDGLPLPVVPNFSTYLMKTGTAVKLSWDRPIDPRKVQWEYGIYYALNAVDLFKQKPKVTSNSTTVIQDLQACEEYIFSVGVVGPLGKGPLLPNPPVVMTQLNMKAPPKCVTVRQYGSDPMKMEIQWSASCSALQTPVGYIVEIHDVTMNKSMSFFINDTTSSELSQWYKINLGAIYTVTVSTGIEGAIASKPVTYRAAPILPPHQVQVYPTKNGTCVVFWQEKDLPESLRNGTKIKYVVLVNEGNQSNESTAQRFEVDGPPFVLTNVTQGEIYTFAVYLQTDGGYRSLLSEVNSIEVPASTWTSIISPSSMVGVVVPLVLVLVVLVAVLTFFVVRHRRLQQSFVRFANSHYDTRSGAATFGSDVLGEDDSPNIRGFSDDEPLVIA